MKIRVLKITPELLRLSLASGVASGAGLLFQWLLFARGIALWLNNVQ
jgi:hypothetical protein